jgi:branched-chain amino acid transport system permease protein
MMFKKLLTTWALHQKQVIYGLIFLALIFPLVFNDPYIISVAVIAGIYAILSISLNLITGHMGIVSLGHAAFFGIGAYTSAILSLRFHWNFLFTFVAASIMAALFGLLLGAPTLRLSGRYLSIVTLAFCEVTRIVEMNWTSLTRGPLGLTNIPPPSIFGFELDSPMRQYYLVLVLCGVTIYAITSLINSRFGRAIIAIKNDEIAAEATGIVVYRYKLLVFAVSSMFAGLGGAFYAHYVGFIDPSSFAFDQSIQILSMTIMGGLGNIFGSIFGSITLIALPEILRPLLAVRQVLYGALLTIMVFMRPEGILGGVNLKHIKQQHDFAKGADKK